MEDDGEPRRRKERLLDAGCDDPVLAEIGDDHVGRVIDLEGADEVGDVEAERATLSGEGAEPFRVTHRAAGEPPGHRPVPRPVVNHETGQVGGLFHEEGGIVPLAEDRHPEPELPGVADLVEHEGLGRLREDTIDEQEVHRFPPRPVGAPTG